MKTKVLVITGGVYSSLGKGIIASSIGCILKHAGFKIAMLKLDPYLNTDPGLLSPIQHGEVFITEDGQKTDLDLGHYERFTGLNLNKSSTQTGGKLYTEILNDEKQNKFNGATIQIIPHLTNKIIEKVDFAIESNNNPDFLIIEIGGTVGDIESLSFIEALRLYNRRNNNVLFVHCSPLFKLNANDEIKTKPTQHSVKNLRNLGINPHILVLRFSELISEREKEKLSWTCDIDANDIFVSKDCKYLYEVPKILYDQGIHNSILKYFGIESKKFEMKDWDNFLESIYVKKDKSVNICIFGQYTELNDSYLSIIESLKIASWKNKVDLKFDLVNNNEINKNNYEEIFSKYNGFIIPDGENSKQVFESSKLLLDYINKTKKPLLAIKLGLELILQYYNHSNFKQDVNGDNSYLGLNEINISKDSNLLKIYDNNNKVKERFWNSWKLDKNLKLSAELKISALNKDNDIVAIESDKLPFFIATLYHPEYLSKPNHPHMIFDSFINACSIKK